VVGAWTVPVPVEPADTSPTGPPVVAFDFDGTITTTDTLRLFLTRVRSPSELAKAFARHAPQLGLALRGGSARDRAKELVCMDVLGGLHHERAEAAATETAEVVRRGLIRPDTEARIRWHQDRGHRIIVVSASFEAYVRQVAASLGIDDVIATRWEVDEDSGVLTGRLDGLNVRGDAKVSLLDDLFGHRCDLEYAYGNSSGDTAMLARARHPVRVGRRPVPLLGDPSAAAPAP
jgi:phosphatidylglycerophosphatase C